MTPPEAPSRPSADEDLAALIAQWQEPDPPELRAERRARARRGLLVRLAVTVALLGVTAAVMFSTRASVAYWLEPETPRELGNLRDRWLSGERTIGSEPNRHVAVSGLVPTRLQAVTKEGLSDGPANPGAVEHIFFCPLYRIVVLTAQPVSVPSLRMVEVDPRFEQLIRDRLAFPEDLTVNVAASGRLVSALDAPHELRPFVERFARRLELDPATMYVLVDGARPGDNTWGVIIWAIAAVPSLFSLFFLLRAFRRHQRAYGSA